MDNVLDPAHPSHSDYLISTNGWRAEQVFDSDAPLDDVTVQRLINELESHALERCGFITTSPEEIVVVQNSHENPRMNFFMETEDFTASLEYIYEATNREVLGIWHTHPNGYGWPSPRDIAGWPNLELGWRYFLVFRGNVTEWRLVRDNANTL